MKQEFKLKNVKLDYPDINVFTSSPWFSPFVFIIYRLVVAIYTTVWTILGGLARLEAGFKWFIFLTNWSYTFLNIHFIIATMIPAYYHYVYKNRKVQACDPNANSHFDQQDIEMDVQNITSQNDKPDSNLRHPRFLILSCKVSWVIFNISATIALLVTAMYWAFDYVPGQHVDASNINAHALNSVLIIIDVMLCNIPFRIFHLIYPMVYGLVYALFTVVYWAVGGTNHRGQPYIYAILDYGANAGLAVLMAAMFVLVAVPISQFLMYGLYRFRVWLVAKKNRRQFIHETENI